MIADDRHTEMNSENEQIVFATVMETVLGVIDGISDEVFILDAVKASKAFDLLDVGF